MPDNFKERRKYVRIYRKFVMTYHEKGRSAVTYNCSQVNNISKGGLSFSTDHPLKEGTVIVVDLQTPFIAAPVSLEGIVLESREKVPGMIYEIRSQFQEISGQALAVLEKIESYGKDKES